MRDDPSYYESCYRCGDDAIGMTRLCHLCHESAETARTALSYDEKVEKFKRCKATETQKSAYQESLGGGGFSLLDT